MTVVEALAHAMPRMDPDMSARVDAELRAHGVRLLTSTRVVGIEPADDAADVAAVVVQDADGERRVPAGLVILAVGVRPNLELANAPTYATTKDPVHYTGMALANAVHGTAPIISPAELERRRAAGEKVQVVDVRSAKDRAKSFVEGSVHVPLAELRERAGELDPAVATVTYCNKGVSGNAAQHVPRNLGFSEVYNLSGGNTNYQAYTNTH
ncbi:rhodanese-like domain-containing protein [Isoptericola variabilis]|uniref:rhodanese-like domain-containing protein n=1 Tax=Isoptericola variabilis TaxID=139208 RepID=UPI0002E8279E|nr:rhodanese-like domain-containing protein [Isoptericola variabilis]TWH30124.1 Pyruvate/2-oxoglutarate dehydrogenase complex, dihydrolipoamide dehydrogenase (E3) component, and related enzymes [Isoptericola variabilis J7]